MINANEIRTGNVLALYGQTVTVVGIDRTLHGDYHITYNDGEKEYRVARYLDQFEPIPLTEKWLIGVGFVKQLDGNYMHPESHEIEVFFHNRGFEVMVDSTCKNHVKHVHSFQNLYFALTGDEVL